jgi:predicted transposase/invertase (TIGR01784 family)
MNLSTAYLKKQEEWKQEGRQEGRQEERLKIARNLLREGADIELVVKATGLAIADIEKLSAQP